MIALIIRGREQREIPFEVVVCAEKLLRKAGLLLLLAVGGRLLFLLELRIKVLVLRIRCLAQSALRKRRSLSVQELVVVVNKLWKAAVGVEGSVIHKLLLLIAA